MRDSINFLISILMIIYLRITVNKVGIYLDNVDTRLLFFFFYLICLI